MPVARSAFKSVFAPSREDVRSTLDNLIGIDDGGALDAALDGVDAIVPIDYIDPELDEMVAKDLDDLMKQQSPDVA